MGVEHSRQSTIDVGGFPPGVARRRIRTTPPDRQARACQQLRLVHPHGPEAGVRVGVDGDWSTVVSDGLLMVTTTLEPPANSTVVCVGIVVMCR